MFVSKKPLAVIFVVTPLGYDLKSETGKYLGCIIDPIGGLGWRVRALTEAITKAHKLLTYPEPTKKIPITMELQ